MTAATACDFALGASLTCVATSPARELPKLPGLSEQLHAHHSCDNCSADYTNDRAFLNLKVHMTTSSRQYFRTAPYDLVEDSHSLRDKPVPDA